MNKTTGTQRMGLFDPMMCSDPMPIPAEHVDVHRTTFTNLGNADEKQIDDIWDGTVGTRRALSDLWIGETRFIKFWKAPPGFEVIDGRLTRKQKTSRPPDIWPEMWQAMSKKEPSLSGLPWRKGSVSRECSEG